MVADALAFKHQGAQPRGAPWSRHASGRLRGHRIRPGVGDRRVSRHPPGESDGVAQRHALEELVDSLVDIAQALLETQHLLTDDREAEVAWLDDAGMHRSDRDLVHSIAGHRYERVVFLLWFK